MLKYVSYIFFVLLVGFSCTPAEKVPVENDVELAKVFNKRLMLSELEGMVPEGASPEDSTKIINAEIERWARETLLMQEAEKNIPQDLNIDGLVRDYRSSLIRHNYEQFLVETQLDSVISQQELNNYYEKNKEQYQLQTPILRCWLVKIPKSAPNQEQLRKWWNRGNTEDLEQMKEYASQNAELYMLEENEWYAQGDVRKQVPQNINMNINQNIAIINGDFQYFFKVLEKKSKGQIAPLTFIQEQMKKVILHKRKIKLLDKRKEELYDRETSKKNVKIFRK